MWLVVRDDGLAVVSISVLDLLPVDLLIVRVLLPIQANTHDHVIRDRHVGSPCPHLLIRVVLDRTHLNRPEANSVVTPSPVLEPFAFNAHHIPASDGSSVRHDVLNIHFLVVVEPLLRPTRRAPCELDRDIISVHILTVEAELIDHRRRVAYQRRVAHHRCIHVMRAIEHAGRDIEVL